MRMMTCQDLFRHGPGARDLLTALERSKGEYGTLRLDHARVQKTLHETEAQLVDAEVQNMRLKQQVDVLGGRPDDGSCPPRHHPHFRPSFIELIGIL